MKTSIFYCPECKVHLQEENGDLICPECARRIPIKSGLPDFLQPTQKGESGTDPNQTWLSNQAVQSRRTIYDHCARELQGMSFCMQAIQKRARPGCRILEVGAGTGHFTRWMAEMVPSDAQIYAFDFSALIMGLARELVGEVANVHLFLANARTPLPFPDGYFDLVLLRLTPLGPSGVPNVAAAFQLLKPGGWFFEAGWKKTHHDTPPTAWALQHGFHQAENHSWQYWRAQSAEEKTAWDVEKEILAAQGGDVDKAAWPEKPISGSDRALRLFSENLLMAHKPG